MLPYFKKSEHQQRGADPYHEVDGELSVTDIISPAVVSQRFVDACESMGFGYNPDFNGTQQAGVRFYQLTLKDGKRHSAAAIKCPSKLGSSNRLLTIYQPQEH